MKDKNLEKLIQRNSEYLELMKSQRETKQVFTNPAAVTKLKNGKIPEVHNNQAKPMHYYISRCTKLLNLADNLTSIEVARKILSVTRWPLNKKLSKSKANKIMKRYARTIDSGKPIKLTHNRINSSEFYRSRDWRELRYKVLIKVGRRCLCCGATPENNNVVLHVDHIKPRSKYPDLELDIDNMQVLCEDCNLGKSNISEEDFRPIEEPPLDDDALAHMMSIKIG